MRYEAVIGLEVHIQLNTASKMFCACSNGDSDQPNLQTCPVCLGMPGMLPVANKEAIRKSVLMALAIGCEINQTSKFDRKHYFYPDLPKGYQISQYDKPFGRSGSVEIESSEGTKTIRINRLHLEEDAGKLIHAAAGTSLVDLNRAGTPLMEIVTEADIATAEEARLFATRLRSIARYLGVSDADMERGNMRFDANISVREAGASELGTKTEIKNMNSFRFMERAIKYEIERQSKLVEEGKEVVAETRGWDEADGETTSQRGKEEAQDYRYFPEPDLPQVIHTAADVEAIRREIPELPHEKQRRFETEYGLSADRARIRAEDKESAAKFEAALERLIEKSGAVDKRATAQKLDNLVDTATSAYAKQSEKPLLTEITAENLADVAAKALNGELGSSATTTVLLEVADGKSVEASTSQYSQESDEDQLGSWADEAIEANPQAAADFRSGNERALAALVGHIMKVSKGTANPSVATKLLKARLEE
jgi:aspartyl-tRNA(Asn)/glutamyl-tRNA(Gln) amidotransferase subunit B